MARPKKEWLRLYADVIYDDKIRSLSIAGRWVWIAVMCLARKSPQPGALIKANSKPVTIGDISDAAKATDKDVKAALEEFIASEMVYLADGIYFVTNWRERQFESDDSAPRVKAHRGRKAGGSEGNCNDATLLQPALQDSYKDRYDSVTKEPESDNCNGLSNDVVTVSPSRDRIPELQSPRIPEKTKTQNLLAEAEQVIAGRADAPAAVKSARSSPPKEAHLAVSLFNERRQLLRGRPATRNAQLEGRMVRLWNDHGESAFVKALDGYFSGLGGSDDFPARKGYDLATFVRQFDTWESGAATKGRKPAAVTTPAVDRYAHLPQRTAH